MAVELRAAAGRGSRCSRPAAERAVSQQHGRFSLRPGGMLD